MHRKETRGLRCVHLTRWNNMCRLSGASIVFLSEGSHLHKKETRVLRCSHDKTESHVQGIRGPNCLRGRG
jgi:hypothetical protein